MLEKKLSTIEAAKAGNFSLSHIYYLLRTGQLPAVRINRQWRIDPCDIQSYVAKRHTSAQEE